MFRCLAALGTLSLAQCQQGSATADGAGVDAAEKQVAQAAPAAGYGKGSDPGGAPAAQARKVSEKNDLYQFEYAYPSQAAAIPGLKAELDRRLEQERAELADAARQFKAEAEAEGFPFRGYSRHTDWKVVADLPHWLSLSAEFYTYSGGAHGMSGFHTLLWDKQAGELRQPKSLFSSARALSRALRQPFCDRLDVQREKKRGEAVDRTSDAMFNECIDPLEQTIILGSSNGKSFDRIGILAPPYNAGPYAEGSYEVTLPVTEAVMNAVKAEFRSAFETGG